MLKELSRRRFLLSLGVAAGLSMVPSFVAAEEEIVEVPIIEEVIPEERPDLSERGGLRPTEEPACVPSGTWEGDCTYYSHAGCVGCSPGQIMANGQPFREWAMTIAFMKLPLNTPVRVTNLDNGKSITARVTDRGGFEKYGILADLSLGVSTAIGNKSRQSRIRINTLDCE